MKGQRQTSEVKVGSPFACVVFLRVRWFPPTVRRHVGYINLASLNWM